MHYSLRGEINYDEENYTLEGIKEFGVFVLYEGNESYKLYKLTLRHNVTPLFYFSYFLKDVSISYNITQSKNNGWLVQIEEV